MSAPTRLFLKFIGNVALVWALSTYMPQYVLLEGGLMAALSVGALLTLFNFFLRPILKLLFLPLRLIATLLAIILLNALFLQAITIVTSIMDTDIVRFEVRGGWWGWIVVSLLIGFANWVMKEVLQHRGQDERK